MKQPDKVHVLPEKSPETVLQNGCVPLPEWTGMDLITGMDYRNGYLYVALSTLNAFNIHKTNFRSHISSLNKISLI